MADKLINYDSTTPTTLEALTGYFTFSDATAEPAGCGAVTCSLYDFGCSTTYSGGHISIDSSNNIIFDHNVALGWGITTAVPS